MKTLLVVLFTVVSAVAQEVRPVPPPGIEVPAADRVEIEAGVRQLGDAIAELRKNPTNAGELPNVEIYHKAADWALRYNEIFDKKQIPAAKRQLAEGLARAAALAKGEMPWNAQTGMVLRAYRSQIDGSVQPYALLIPQRLGQEGANAPFPLHFWCHGRGETLSELAFIEGARKSGEFTPPGAIVCYLYGRYCCANKFAGERDLFEALDDIRARYPIDERRLAIRGFSMGGASTWQFATHYSDMWAAAAPGAGFAETAEFFKIFAPGKEAPPAWEQKLWRWYDCTTMAANLANTTTIAYSGEIDGQKQAADIMVKYAAGEGLSFPHIIGAKMGHKYDEPSKVEIAKLVDAAVAKGREAFPKKVRLVTYSLIYPSADWLTISRMEKQWEKAEAEAEFDHDTLKIRTTNVAEINVACGSGEESILEQLKGCKRVIIDGQTPDNAITAHFSTQSAAGSRTHDGAFSVYLKKQGGKWMNNWDIRYALRDGKCDGLCGPIDHAFMSEFVFVRPTGRPLNDAVGAWTKAEMERAIVQWRRVYRGEIQAIDDTEMLNYCENGSQPKGGEPNLILWGDTSSNLYLAKIAGKLPLKWNAETLELGGLKVDAAHHAPIMIYPNPLNPVRYVVLNSGFTFREAAALNNSDQTPKLPDWAIVDLRTPPGPKWPGKIVDAGFFDENWK